jgi:ribosomal-protein-serine acetyltransferase
MLKFQIDNELELRPYVEADAEEIFAVVKVNYEHLRPFLHWVVPEYSLQSVKEFIVQSQKDFDERKSEVYGIFYQNTLVGTISFVNFDWNSQRTEIGYWIAKDHSGRGIITKACQALINYAFDELGMNRIEIRAATENIRSRAIPEKLGFQLEGVLRQSMWRHTRLYDVAIYGLLEKDWRNFSEK